MTAAAMAGPAAASVWQPTRMSRLEARHTIVLATFLATLTAYVERVGFSIAFTAMAKQARLDEAGKGTVLSAFYWGYGLSQVRLNGRCCLPPAGATGCLRCRGMQLAGLLESPPSACCHRGAVRAEARLPGAGCRHTGQPGMARHRTLSAA
jgi:hypothetical protein